MNNALEIKKHPRKYLPENHLTLQDWDTIEPYFNELLARQIASGDELETWLQDMSELEAMITEDVCWRQIRMTCDTANKDLEAAFNFFYTEIQPKIEPLAFELSKKLINSPFIGDLDKEKYFTYLRSVRKSVELFREENIPIQSELAVSQQQYGVITGQMGIEVNGKQYTLPQAAKFFESHDRSLREEVYRKINERRLQDKAKLDSLFSRLIKLRQQEAVNAGFENYRDYKFESLGRFDYTREDCFDFHTSVREHVLPLAGILLQKKKERLGLEVFRPWDTEAEPEGILPLEPFKDGKDLIDKTIECFSRLRPFFGDCIRQMNAMHHLDLESRNGKAPGGYNMPLAESGAPFIFMNAAGQMQDVTTMVHEGGHAIHSFLTHDLELNAFKNYPIEMAEVASMAMELFSMDHWDVFFENEHDLRRAKEHQLERVITVFPWIAAIDKFQHWLYEHPQHSETERTENWIKIFEEFSPSVVDYSGLENYVANGWQKQLHLFEVPFYYIEYGIAQLGALGLWKQYKEDPEKALDNYVRALSLGGTKTLPELYQAAGLKFDFSSGNIKSLMEFVKEEMAQLTR